MKRSTWILVGVLLALAAIVWFSRGSQENYNVGDQLAIKNTDKIHKVFIADRSDKRILLTKGQDGWLVNEKYPVRQGAIDLLLETFNQVRVKSYVAKAAEKNVVEELRTRGLKVEVYDKNDEFIKVYYVGGAAPGKLGTYMLQDGDNHLYITHLGSWEGIITPRFMLNEIDWRDKTLFQYEPDKITELTVDYPAAKQASFTLKRTGKGQHEVFPLVPDAAFKFAGKEPIKAQVLYYLKGYDNIVAEAFESDHPQRDSIFRSTPFCILSVSDDEGSKNVKLYPIPGRVTGTLADGTPRRGAIERYYAAINENEEFMLVQHRIFQRLLAQYDFFFTEAEKVGN